MYWETKTNIKITPFLLPFLSSISLFHPRFLNSYPTQGGTGGDGVGIWSVPNNFSLLLLPSPTFHLLDHGFFSWAAMLQEKKICFNTSSPQAAVPSGNIHLLWCGVIHGWQCGGSQIRRMEQLLLFLLWPWSSFCCIACFLFSHCLCAALFALS